MKDFPFPIESVRSSSDFSGVARRGNNPDFLIVDTPPGGLAFITESAEAADLVLLPTGVSPMDIDRTQVTLSWLIEMGIPEFDQYPSGKHQLEEGLNRQPRRFRL